MLTYLRLLRLLRLICLKVNKLLHPNLSLFFKCNKFTKGQKRPTKNETRMKMSTLEHTTVNFRGFLSKIKQDALTISTSVSHDVILSHVVQHTDANWLMPCILVGFQNRHSTLVAFSQKSFRNQKPLFYFEGFSFRFPRKP